MVLFGFGFLCSSSHLEQGARVFNGENTDVAAVIAVDDEVVPGPTDVTDVVVTGLETNTTIIPRNSPIQGFNCL